MEFIIISSNFVKMFILTLLSFFIYIKVTNYKDNSIYKTILAVFSSINIAILYIGLIQYFETFSVIILLYFLYGVIINFLSGERKGYYKIISYIISCVIAYVIYLIATIISGVLVWFIAQKGESRNPISLIIIPCVAILLTFFIFRIKRFKNGFNFLEYSSINKDITIFTILFGGIVIFLYVLCQNNNEFIFNLLLIIESIFIAYWLVFWIKKQITKNYKNRMRDRTIEMQKAEIDEQARVMEELKEENLKLASAIHKYNKKFSALEFAMKNLETSTEFANEISVILEETKEASKNFAKEVETKINKLPLTNNVGIDNMFKYMQNEARKNNINFDLKLNTSINPLLETIISKDKFETLIGDHLKDAIIAVNKSEASYKSILVTLGLVDGIYEFSVFDTGIEFEIDTLVKLGKEQVTTHKDEGGTGIGFMTTFETLKECKASLIIEEYNPETTNYTKTVIIRFDGKNEYKICSYRAEKIKEHKHERRIIIKKLK